MHEAQLILILLPFRYDPAAITTVNGVSYNCRALKAGKLIPWQALQITMSQKSTHGLDYQSGHMTTWNKFCFTGGYIEVNVSLPGVTDVT